MRGNGNQSPLPLFIFVSMSPAETILEQYIGPKLIADLKESQKGKGLIASGKSADSLTFTVERSGSKVTLKMWGAHWWDFQQNGRRPNKTGGRPSTWFVNVIKNWIQVKGLSIPLKAAGAIAYNIINEGIPVPNRFNKGGVLSEPLGEQRIRNLLIPSLQEKYVEYLGSKLFMN